MDQHQSDQWAICPKAFQECLQNNDVIIDVREQWEHEEEAVVDRNIPLPEIPGKIAVLEPFKKEKIILHCQSGKRSHQGCKYLRKLGFEMVYHLDGGLMAYKNYLNKA